MPEERKLVTVLFADIVGSTAFGHEHDPELVRRRLREVFADASAALTSHGGTVEKFIGDAVMAVFGVPTSHEDDAKRALRAAFELRDRLARSSLGLPLECRVGIATGEAVAETNRTGDFLVTGEVTNLAARLQQLAEPGEILVDRVTRDLTATIATFGESRRVKPKGVQHLDAHPGLSMRARPSERDELLDPPGTRFVGRQSELRMLREAYERVASQRHAYLVTVFGGPGIGKSRLARELVGEIGPERARVGRCLPYGSGITFYPLERIIHADAGVEPTDAVEDARGKLRATIEGALGHGDDTDAVAARTMVMAGLGSRETDLADIADTELPDELRWGVRRYFEARAATDPLVLVFEDIHWAEPALLDLIEHVGEWGRAPILVLCLARPELLDVRPGWGGGHTNATAIRLEALGPAETRELVLARTTDVAVSDGLVGQILERAEGNPLYVEQFGQLMRSGDRTAVPPNIHSLIAARLDGSPAEVKHWLQVASVFGRVFWSSALPAIGGAPGPSGQVIADAIRRGFIGEADEGRRGGRGRAYRFTHVLIREVAYASVPKSERAALHDRCARWYEETLGDRREDFVDVVAHHAEQAFRMAVEVRLPASALGRRALDRLLPAAERAGDRGDSQSASGLYERASGVLDAGVLDDPRRDAIRAYTILLRHQLEPTPAHEAELEAAIEELRGRDVGKPYVLLLIERLRSLAGGESADAPVYDEPEPRYRARFDDLFGQAQAVARSLDDPHLIAQVMFLSTVASMRDRVAYRAAVTEALAVVRAMGTRRWLFECMIALANAQAEAGEIGASLRLGAEAYELARASGSRLQRLRTTDHLAAFHRFAGDYEQAIHFGEEAMALAAELGTFEIPASLLQLSLALTYSGAPERARALLEPYRKRYAGQFPYHSLVQTYLEAGDIAGARRMIDEGLALVRPGRVRLYLEMLRAEALGDADGMLRIYDSLATTQRFGAGFMLGGYGPRVGRALIRMGRPLEARRVLGAALGFYRDPAAHRRRAEIESLMSRAEAPVR